MPENKFKRTVFIMLILILTVGCQAWEDRQTVAKVNGEAIKKKPYRLIYQARYQGLLQAHPQKPAGMEPKLAKEIIEEMINDVLFFQEAKKRNLVPPMEEVNKSMGHVKEGGAPGPAFLKAIAEKGITMEEIREEMQRRLAIGALRRELTKNIETTEKEAQEFYRQNKSLFVIPPQFQVRLFYAPDAAQAQAYLDQIRSGKGRFEDLVKKNPPQLAQMLGVEPTWIFAEGFSPEMGKVMMDTKVGGVGGPVKGMEGFYLIKVYAKKTRRPESFKEAKDKIIRNLNQEKAQAALNGWLAEQKKKAAIEVRESRLSVKVEPPTSAKTMMPPRTPQPKASGSKG